MTKTLCCVTAGLICLGAIAARGQSPPYNPFGERGKANTNSTLNMHLCPDDKWEIGEDAWGKIVRVNMLKIADADWEKLPGVKKAWRMQGFEGEDGMPFGAWHWGSDSILFLMEGPTPSTPGKSITHNRRVSGVNLTLSGTATASSTYSSTYKAAKAFDADESTRWEAGPGSRAPE